MHSNNTHAHKSKLRTGQSSPAFRAVNVTLLGLRPARDEPPLGEKRANDKNAIASLYKKHREEEYARKTERVRRTENGRE